MTLHKHLHWLSESKGFIALVPFQQRHYIHMICIETVPHEEGHKIRCYGNSDACCDVRQGGRT